MEDCNKDFDLTSLRDMYVNYINYVCKGLSDFVKNDNWDNINTTVGQLRGAIMALKTLDDFRINNEK